MCLHLQVIFVRGFSVVFRNISHWLVLAGVCVDKQLNEDCSLGRRYNIVEHSRYIMIERRYIMIERSYIIIESRL
jgi:hypothetical protein